MKSIVLLNAARLLAKLYWVPMLLAIGLGIAGVSFWIVAATVIPFIASYAVFGIFISRIRCPECGYRAYQEEAYSDGLRLKFKKPIGAIIESCPRCGSKM
jgi:ssDNA-binding Zn-finger/Zn-ribbon topoisomerase 1